MMMLTMIIKICEETLIKYDDDYDFMIMMMVDDDFMIMMMIDAID